MRRPIRSFIVITLSLVMVASAVIEAGAQTRRDRRARSREVIESLELFGKVYERVARSYVDEVDPRDLIETAIEGMLAELDPHTALLTAEIYDELMVSTQGEFGGLGIQITVRDDYPTVVSPIDDTPAFRLGIRGGDQIVEIEGESTQGWKQTDAVSKLRGTKGTAVSIGIRRPGQAQILPFTIVRDIIKIESVPHAFLIDEEAGVGYIRISNFARTTARELQDRIVELESQGMRSLILDLRFNPGGLLQAAKETSEIFLEKDDLIVYTKGRLAQQNMSYYATNRGGSKWTSRPLIVMINGSSASASEILAGAIQDHDVGLVLGQTSFGKGSVQTVFELNDTEALKLTTAKYYTPSGRSIHRDRSHEGEILAENGDDLEEAVDEEIDNREIFYTDAQREVFGGGGINPDLDIEPSLLSNFAVALERDATFFHYTNEFATHNPQPEPDFAITDAMVDEFWTLAQGREDLPGFFEDMEVEFTRELFDENRDYVEEGIRREISRRFWGSSASYRVSLERDGQVWEAVDLLRRAKSQAELFRLAEERRMQKLAEAKATKAEDKSAAN